MKILKRILIVFTLLILVIGGCIYYAFKIEPYRVTLNEFALNEEKPDREHLKIVQISDLHIKADFTYKNLDKVIKKVNEQNPDIVIFTGDLYDNYAIYRDDENIVTALQKIEASYGKIAIWGNRDYGGGAERTYAAVMEDAGFTLLKNENWYIMDKGKRQSAQFRQVSTKIFLFFLLKNVGKQRFLVKKGKLWRNIDKIRKNCHNTS